MYTLVDRVDDGGTPNRRRESETRLQVPPNIGMDTKSTDYQFPDVHSNDESMSSTEYPFINNDNDTSTNRENILFIYLDFHSQLSTNSTAALRAINHDVQTYTDLSTCLSVLRSSQDKIFFISSSNDKQLIEEVHNANSVEAIFILNPDAHLDSRFPKLYGVYAHFEELLMALKNTLEWFEQTQMELFVFEHDRIFLWSQLWKEEHIKLKKPKDSSNKEKLVHMAENYYRGNIRLHQLIVEFAQSYKKTDPFQWCFSSPFPSRLLNRALRSHDTEQLNTCLFLISDVARTMQKSNKKSSCELYRGMKMTNEFLDKLENNVGQLIRPKGFLLCSQSRKPALAVASSPDHRQDLMSVLFKITYDTSVPLAELSMKDNTSLMIFDVYTAFRVKYVNRGQVSIVKIEPADEDGRSLARKYRLKYESESVKDLLAQLLVPPKPPARLPPLHRPSLPIILSTHLSTDDVRLTIILDNDDEIQAQDLVKRGEIDQAIGAYKDIKPVSAKILNTIGILYSEKKGNYDSAIKYHEQALKIQEKNDEDVTGTLSQLGIVHQNRHEFDMALSYHSRALHIREKADPVDQATVANSLIGIANAYWGQQNLSKALNYAKQALSLNEAIQSGNDLHIAANLAILANIHHNTGDTEHALELATRALALLESCVSSDSSSLASLLNNVATIQVARGLFADARLNFDKALKICEATLPEGHPKRMAMQINIQRITEMEQTNIQGIIEMEQMNEAETEC